MSEKTPYKGLKRYTPLKRTPLPRATNPIARKTPKKSGRGLKGKAVSVAQREYHDAICSRVGCMACRIDYGFVNTHVSVHHVDGRTKPWAHWAVLAPCAGHHQKGTGGEGFIAIHPDKARFEARYGTQFALWQEQNRLLLESGYAGPMPPEDMPWCG